MGNRIFLQELEAWVSLKMVSTQFRILGKWLLPCRLGERISRKDSMIERTGETWRLGLDWEPTRYAELPVTSRAHIVGG